VKRILIIDDNNEVLGTYRQILEHAGYEVLVASDGKKGISSFREKLPNLVITDIFMPEKEGLETILEWKRDFPDVKIIAISGGGNIAPDDYLKYAKQFEAMYTLTKPIEREELLETILECLS
jgi:DNA-binding NtrC family response regulator